MLPTPRSPSPFLDTWKDALLEVFLEQPNSLTGRMEPATGLTDVELALSATEQGTAIGALFGTAVERPDTQGQYYVILDLAVLTSDLPAMTYAHDSTVYLQVRKAGDIEVEAFKKRVRRRKY